MTSAITHQIIHRWETTTRTSATAQALLRHQLDDAIIVATTNNVGPCQRFNDRLHCGACLEGRTGTEATAEVDGQLDVDAGRPRSRCPTPVTELPRRAERAGSRSLAD